MKVFRRLLYGCIVGAWTAGGLAVLAYALYLLPVSLHMFHPVTSLAAWVYQHSLSRGGKVGAGLLYAAVLYATFNSLRGLFIRAQVQRLVRAYRGTYSSAS